MSKGETKNKEDLKAIPLSTMLGRGDFFLAQDKKYKIEVMKLRDIEEFLADRISVGPQLFNFTNAEARANLEKWIPRVLTLDGEPMTLANLMDAGWDLNDLKRMWKEVLEISG